MGFSKSVDLLAAAFMEIMIRVYVIWGIVEGYLYRFKNYYLTFGSTRLPEYSCAYVVM